MLRRRWVVPLLLLGALMRLSVFAYDSVDGDIFRAWSQHAVDRGAATLYGHGEAWLAPSTVTYRDAVVRVDYPPFALVLLEAVGTWHRSLTGAGAASSPTFEILLKVVLVAFQVATVGLIFVFVLRHSTRARAWMMAVVLWVNPAAILDAAMFGHLDALFVLPAVGALLAAAGGLPFLAGALIALASLTKLQAVILVPVVGVAIGNCCGRSDRSQRVAALLAAVGAAVAVVTIVTAPVVAAGGFWRMTGALVGLAAGDDFGSAANIWWLVGHAGRVVHRFDGGGVFDMLVMPASTVPFSTMKDFGLPAPELLGLLAFASVYLWALWTARRVGETWLIAALGGLAFHAYFSLAAQAHSHHLYPAVPLLVLAAAGRSAFTPVLFGVSGVAALNMYFSDGPGVRLDLLWIDATLLLAGANLVLLAWHAAVFHRQTVHFLRHRDTETQRRNFIPPLDVPHFTR